MEFLKTYMNILQMMNLLVWIYFFQNEISRLTHTFEQIFIRISKSKQFTIF